MLTSIMVSLFILWLLGIATSTTLGGSIHVLLALAAMIVIFNLVRVGAGHRVL